MEQAAEFVYVIASFEARAVKIGRSTDPSARLASLQAGSPVALYIAVTFPGGPRLERHLHRQFSDRRMHGEWFDFAAADPVTEVTAAVKAYVPVPGQADRARSRGDGVPLYSLALSGSEWATIEWVRSHGGAGAAVKVTAAEVAVDILAIESTAKMALARLVKLNVLLKTAPRSSTYQLNPRRFWEGSGEAQVQACRRLDPPAITPDAKAIAAAKKKAAADEKTAEKAPRARRAPNGEGR